MNKNRILLLLLSLIAVLFTCISVFWDGNEKTGYLTGNPGDTVLMFEDYDLSIKGWDKNGITYFFIPSFISIDRISQERLDYKMRLDDGEILASPNLSTVQDIVVEDENFVTPWKICFLSSTNLNTAFIDMEGLDVSSISHDAYIPVKLSLFDENGYSELLNEQVFIKGRGNSTWEAAKKPFEIKSKIPISCCGMTKGKKWTFLANYYDDTKILNKLAFNLSNELGMEYTIQSEWIDLYINGNYYGNYLVCKEPTLRNNTIGILEMEQINDPFFVNSAYNDGVIKGYDYLVPFKNISGGYLIEKNWEESYDLKRAGFHENGNCFTIKSPNNASLDEVRYIQSYTKKIDDEISSGNLSNIDCYSFCIRFIIDELMYNVDSSRTSSYYYKKQNDNTLYAGPCWDYDLACGRVRESSFNDYTGTLLHQDYDWVLDWDSKLMDNSQYKKYAAEIFNSNLDVLEQQYLESVDRYEEIVRDSVIMDQVRWADDDSGEARGYYDIIGNKYRHVKLFLYERTKHLADMFGNTNCITDNDINTDETHTLTFISGDQEVITWSVRDGSQIPENALPAYDHSIYSGWYYKTAKVPYSYFIPIYEDMVFVLRHNKTAS